MVMGILKETFFEVIILVLVTLLFFAMIAKATDPTMFILRLHGKDAGTLVEALHSARGDVTLTYSDIPASTPIIFSYKQDAVYLSAAKPQQTTAESPFKTKKTEEKGPLTVRRQYGMVKDMDEPLSVVEKELVVPATIDYYKRPTIIDFGELATQKNCFFGTTLYRIETKLELEIPETLKDITQALEQTLLVQKLQATRLPKHTLKIIIEESGTGLVLKPSTNAQAHNAETLACLLQEYLLAAYPDAVVENVASTDDAVTLTIVVPENLKAPEHEPERVQLIRALLLALNDVTLN